MLSRSRQTPQHADRGGGLSSPRALSRRKAKGAADGWIVDGAVISNERLRLWTA
jgi:hypothetical protein